MKTLTFLKLTALSMIVFVASGCASTGVGQKGGFFESSRHALQGCGAGLAAGFGVSKATGGEARKNNVSALAGCAIGAFSGHQSDKNRANLNAELGRFGYKVVPTGVFSSKLVSNGQVNGELFDVNSAELTPQAKQLWSQLAAIAKKYDQQVIIEAHSDTSGAAGRNLTLSQQRADSMAKVFLEAGVPYANIKATGYGESRPAVQPGNSPANRRVEVTFNTTEK